MISSHHALNTDITRAGCEDFERMSHVQISRCCIQMQARSVYMLEYAVVPAMVVGPASLYWTSNDATRENSTDTPSSPEKHYDTYRF